MFNVQYYSFAKVVKKSKDKEIFLFFFLNSNFLEQTRLFSEQKIPTIKFGLSGFHLKLVYDFLSIDDIDTFWKFF